MPGEPPLQSRAPDATGGYYQPVRADLAARRRIALARIRCALAGASFDVAAEYAATYMSNRNPTLTPLAAFVDGAPVALDAIAAGSVVTLAAGWTDDSAESFPVLDRAGADAGGASRGDDASHGWRRRRHRRREHRPHRRRPGAVHDDDMDGAVDAGLVSTCSSSSTTAAAASTSPAYDATVR